MRFGLFCIVLIFSGSSCLEAQINVSDHSVSGAFELVQGKNAADIFIDPADAEVVRIAAEALKSDIELVTGIAPTIQSGAEKISSNPVIIGTIGHSALIDQLDKSGKLSLDRVRGKWETFSITMVDQPLKGVRKALVIAGSDRRGTSYGVFELSRIMGVSPWVWWADVTPAHKDALYVTGTSVEGPPSVKYRGIFLNDEDWGLQPWAARNMDTDIKDIGPKTYAKIFELLLRLKANFIWPAMHPCTKAFYYYPGNPKVADKYAIVVGSSHCEPILRDNVFEWAENYEQEYGVKPGEWRYDAYKEQIYRYWEDRAKQSSTYESVYTVGMRGVHDGSMPGPKSKPEKIKLLDQIIVDQRNILEKSKDKPANQIPQIFCPYKEVLQLYQGGLNLPEDVTIVWSDDNHGYIRQLSDPKEQKRSGGSGVYYHLSYWGAPHDYLWICSTAPSLISYELTKAYQFDASRLWVINVGDIKPAEMEIQFSMDLAWNVADWTPDKAYQYAEKWASETFGEEFAAPIAKIKSEYYRLAQCGKPEHLGMLAFSDINEDERITAYEAIVKDAKALAEKIPQRLRDAYFQLILYPTQGACLMNEKIFYARKSQEMESKNEKMAIDYALKAKSAFDQIRELTKIYNTGIADGKWNGMMDWHPRDLQVFYMPKVSSAAEKYVEDSVKYRMVAKKEYVDSIQGGSFSLKQSNISNLIVLDANNFVKKSEASGQTLQVFEGLGLGGYGISIMPFTTPPIAGNNVNKATCVEYKVKLSAGSHTITLECLPTQGMYKDRSLRYAVSVNGDDPQIVDVNDTREDRTWKENVLRGFSLGTSIHNVGTTGEAVIKVYLLDPGLVVNRIEVL
ncbi:MAG TPA: glycosyl hydrolase 115 family protein [Bacteroidales bacterium]